MSSEEDLSVDKHKTTVSGHRETAATYRPQGAALGGPALDLDIHPPEWEAVYFWCLTCEPVAQTTYGLEREKAVPGRLWVGKKRSRELEKGVGGNRILMNVCSHLLCCLWDFYLGNEI